MMGESVFLAVTMRGAANPAAPTAAPAAICKKSRRRMMDDMRVTPFEEGSSSRIIREGEAPAESHALRTTAQQELRPPKFEFANSFCRRPLWRRRQPWRPPRLCLQRLYRLQPSPRRQLSFLLQLFLQRLLRRLRLCRPPLFP